MENYANIVRDWLDDAQEEEVLSMIVMILEFYITKFDRQLNSTMSLIKKGFYKYKDFLKESE